MNSEEAICRVCRGEGTEAEPLFHPCKCSGSIKFVHQDCLEEWLAHSNKKYCELCGHQYTFSPLYDPSMPEDIPKSVIVRQMVTSTITATGAVARVVFVISMWTILLPYLVYWLTRFYFWSGQSFVPADIQSVNGNMTDVPMSTRFVEHSSWNEWYLSIRDNNTVGGIISHTGVLEGATGTALFLYSATRIALAIIARTTKKVFGIKLSDEQFNQVVESTVELLAKCFEGSVVALVAVLLFIALFILRDWITTNMPAPAMAFEDPNDQLDDEANNVNINNNEDNININNNIGENNNNNNAQNHLMQDNADLNNRNNVIRVQAQPLAAEDPNRRPFFEPPLLDLPTLELPPGERPIRQHHQLRRQHPLNRRDTAVNHSGVRLGSEEPEENTQDSNSETEEAVNDSTVENSVGQSSRKGKSVDTNTNVEDMWDSWSVVYDNSATTSENHEPKGPEFTPTFTSESSRGIFAHAKYPDLRGNGTNNDDSSDSSSEISNEEEGRVYRPDEQAAGADHRDIDAFLWGIRDVHNANPIPLENGELIEQQPRAQPEENPELLGDDMRFGMDGDMDDNFGDLEGAEGFIEAIGLRGPLVNIFQHFILAFSMVSVVLACGAWIPYVVGRAVISLHPIRAILYPIHICTSLVDYTVELVLDKMFPLLWIPIKPFAVVLVNMVGPLILPFVYWAIPELKQALSGMEGGLWDNLSMPQIHSLILNNLRSSVIIDLLFPWIKNGATTAVTSVTGGESYVETMAAATTVIEVAASFGSGTTADNNGILSSYFGDFGGSIDRMISSAGSLAASLGVANRPLVGAGTAPVWEREIWERFVAWKIPIDRIAVGLHQAAIGRTMNDRLITIIIGHLVGVLFAWLTVRYMPRKFRQTALYYSSEMFLMMIKVSGFVLIELILFPTMCGFCLDFSLISLQSGASIASRYTFFVRHPRISMLVHWFVGMVFMYHFANFISYCREVLRPGVLWFIRDPNDPQFRPMRDILEKNIIVHLRKIATSAFMYCTTIIMCFGVTSWFMAMVLPSTLPMHWRWDSGSVANTKSVSTAQTTMSPGIQSANVNNDTGDGNGTLGMTSSSPISQVSIDYPLDLFLFHLMLPMAITWGRPQDVLRSIFSKWWSLSAKIVRLSEFIVGKRDEIEEGTWILDKVPSLPIILPSLWMPVGTVRDVFAEFESRYCDEARGDVEDRESLPTTMYRGMLQERIDEALAAKHPGVQFILDGQNMRVPILDTVPAVPGRKMLVPVDEHGKPAEDKYDYEAADNPNRADVDDERDLPEPAPSDVENDLRYKPEHYTIIYTPPEFKMHIFGFIAIGWITVGSTFITLFVSSLLIGRIIYTRLWRLPTHDLYSLVIGLLVVILVSATINKTVAQIGKLLDQSEDRERRIAQIKAQVKRGAKASWNVFVTIGVFYGIIPAIYSLIVELYIVIVARDYLDKTGVDIVFSRNIQQAIMGNWLFSVLNIRFVISLLGSMPDLYWSRQLDRLFTGPPHTWHVMRGLYIFALPVISISLLCIAIPFAMTAFAMRYRDGTVTWESFAPVIALEEIELLSRSCKTILVVSVCCGIIWQGVSYYRKWSRHVRDRVYLVGQQLHNLDDNMANHDSDTQDESDGSGENGENGEDYGSENEIAVAQEIGVDVQ